MKKIILIGIQARSSSKRLPNKIHMVIDGKSILQRIIESAIGCCTYLRHDAIRKGFEIKVVLLIPKGDKAGTLFKNQIDILEGDESDVLSRYVEAAKKYNADYIVRLTGDCVFLHTPIIAKHIKSAFFTEKDYTTNTMIRTFPEGQDIEVVSKRLLEFLDKNAKSFEDREHVTLYLRKNKFPYEFSIYGKVKPSICHVLNYFDDSDKKTSIDTEDDFIKAVTEFSKLREKIEAAYEYGFWVV